MTNPPQALLNHDCSLKWSRENTQKKIFDKLKKQKNKKKLMSTKSDTRH